MSDHTPEASRIHHVVVRVPRSGTDPSDPWVDDTYALIERFERERSAAGAEDAIELSSVLAASDYLWARFGLRASWERLDVAGLFAMFARFAASPRWRRDCMATLESFYAYLVKTRTVDPDAGARIQAELRAQRSAAEAELSESTELSRTPNRRERRARAAIEARVARRR